MGGKTSEWQIVSVFVRNTKLGQWEIELRIIVQSVIAYYLEFYLTKQIICSRKKLTLRPRIDFLTLLIKFMKITDQPVTVRRCGIKPRICYNFTRWHARIPAFIWSQFPPASPLHGLPCIFSQTSISDLSVVEKW